MTDLTPNDLSHLSDEEFNALCPQGEHAPGPEPPTSQITFNAPSPPEEVIRLDNEGFHYKGQFVADAGEAHRLMMAFLEQNTKTKPEPPTDEELVAFLYMIDPDDELSDLAMARAALHRWGHG